jgi:hypothetical protein
MVDFSGTFDTTNALSGMFLWITFSYISSLLNCDLQRIIQSNPLATHLFGLIAFLFLFTLLDSNNKTSLGVVYAKTLIIYGLFLLMVKSKWYFIIPVLVLLLVDQSIKKNNAFKEAAGTSTEKDKAMQERATQVLNIMIIVLILLGSVQYMYLQYVEYGSKFSLYAFFFGITKCKKQMPDYVRLSRK